MEHKKDVISKAKVIAQNTKYLQENADIAVYLLLKNERYWENQPVANSIRLAIRNHLEQITFSTVNSLFITCLILGFDEFKGLRN